MQKLLIGLFIGIGLVACSEKVNSVDYYMTHESEAQTQQQKCKKMGYENTKNSQNCDNAMEAMSKITQIKMQKSMMKGGW